jgi:hypothetical protein
VSETRESLLAEIHAHIERLGERLGLPPARIHDTIRRKLGRANIRAWLAEIEASHTPGWWHSLERAATEAQIQRDAIRVAEQLPSAQLAHLPEFALLDLVPERLRSLAREWLPRMGGMLVLGPTGAGKTALAAYIARRLVLAPPTDAARQMLDGEDARQRVAWTTARAIGRARRAHPLGQGDPPDVRAASDADVTVVDDLGWEGDPSDVLGVIADRYDTGRPTIVTSGLTEDALRERYGAAVIRRIGEAGGREGTIVDLFAGQKAAE